MSHNNIPSLDAHAVLIPSGTMCSQPLSPIRYYAGIGSRETPDTVGLLMTSIAESLAERGYVLRSGGAPGADTFFEQGAPKELREIYLPWPGFNGNSSPLHKVTSQAMSVAKRFHPNWERLSDAGKKLMARNAYQILGKDLRTPVEFVVCWTPGGKVIGGTGQALRMAKRLEIPVFNLAVPGTPMRLEYFIKALH